VGTSISIDRQRLIVNTASQDFISLQALIKREASAVSDDQCSNLVGSIYASLCGPQILRHAALHKPEPYWAFARELQPKGEPVSWDWRPIEYPAILYSETINDYNRPIPTEVLKEANANDELRPIISEQRLGRDNLLMPCLWLKPSRLLISKTLYIPEPLIMFDSYHNYCTDSRISVKFPPELDNILAVTHAELLLFNDNHRVFQMVNTSDWESFVAKTENLNLEAILEMVSTSKSSTVASFIIFNTARPSEFWKALHDRYLDHFIAIFETLKGHSDEIRIWNANHKGGILSIGNYAVNFTEFDRENIKELLQDPADKSFQLTSWRFL